MLALGRILARAPRLLLLDELSLGLAPLVVTRLLTAVRAAADRTGVGVLLVEQHARAALQVSDHAYVMNRGRIQVDRPARDLLAQAGLLQSAYLANNAAGPDIPESADTGPERIDLPTDGSTT